MATDARWRGHIRLAVAVLWAVFAFHGVGRAASPEPDRVSLGESTIAWSTVKYAITAGNGFVAGSLDTKTIVDRTFRTYVLENRYLKVTLVPGFGGRILSIIYKPTGHEELYRSEGRRSLRDQGRQFLLRLADGVWRHLPHLPRCRARQDMAEAMGFQGGEAGRRRSDRGDVAARTISNIPAAPKQFSRGSTVSKRLITSR